MEAPTMPKDDKAEPVVPPTHILKASQKVIERIAELWWHEFGSKAVLLWAQGHTRNLETCCRAVQQEHGRLNSDWQDPRLGNAVMRIADQFISG